MTIDFCVDLTFYQYSKIPFKLYFIKKPHCGSMSFIYWQTQKHGCFLSLSLTCILLIYTVSTSSEHPSIFPNVQKRVKSHRMIFFLNQFDKNTHGIRYMFFLYFVLISFAFDSFIFIAYLNFQLRLEYCSLLEAV